MTISPIFGSIYQSSREAVMNSTLPLKPFQARPKGGMSELARFMEPACSFREEANYSNMGYFFAGESAAVAAGTTWEELVAASLLKPLEREVTPSP